MQFNTTIFSSQKQIVEDKTFQITTVEQITTIVCDKCGFTLTGTKDEIEQSDFLIFEDLTLCDECSF